MNVIGTIIRVSVPKVDAMLSCLSTWKEGNGPEQRNNWSFIMDLSSGRLRHSAISG